MEEGHYITLLKVTQALHKEILENKLLSNEEHIKILIGIQFRIFVQYLKSITKGAVYYLEIIID